MAGLPMSSLWATWLTTRPLAGVAAQRAFDAI